MEREKKILSKSLTASGITGIVLTHNGERLIEQCLSSLSFCDALLVVDSGSTDKTFSIAESFNTTFIHRNWEGFASQFTFAQSLVQTRWFFILDQDEICPENLGKAIIEKIKESELAEETSQDPFVAFSVGRKSWYFNRFMKHSGWYPDHILRVFRTGCVEFYQDAHIHYKPLGRYKHIQSPDAELIHYPYTGFFHQLNKLNTYAQQGADHMHDKGKKGGLCKGIVHGLGRFLRIYFLKRGFLDGKAGFLVAVHGAFYAFSKYIRVLDASWGTPYNQHNSKKK